MDVSKSTLPPWLGASIVLHGLAAVAFWGSEFETAEVRPPPAPPVQVSLLPAEAVPVPAAIQTPPPLAEPVAPASVSTPPPSVDPPMPPRVVEKAPGVKQAPPPVVRPDPPPASPATRAVAMSVAMAAAATPAKASIASPPAESRAAPALDPMPDFVAEVRARIERKKRYPALARRRSEEGRVVARVSIGGDGELRGIEIDAAGSMLLGRATRAAIEKAAPFPAPPKGPVVVEVPVRWRVRS